jgi:D-tyrosyl-tRNA(Tyr) deacylase
MVAAVVAGLREHGLQVEQGVFGAHMTVALVNDGPVTLVIEVEGARII